jgi:AmpD protein
MYRPVEALHDTGFSTRNMALEEFPAPGDDDWLTGARRAPSPNQDARPPDVPVDLLVIHNISLPPGEFGGDWVEDLFLNRLDPAAHPYFAGIAALRVSAHLLIRRDGALVQFVPLGRRAWHAGASCFAGREACNDFSIGIELEGSDETPFTDAQYARLAAVSREIVQRYPAIGAGRIVGHSDIAPGRKTDPGPHFDWQRFREALARA